MKTSHYFSWLILGMMALSLYIILFQEDSKNPPHDTPSSMTGVAEDPAFDAEKLQNYFSTLTEKQKFMGNILLQKRDTPLFSGSFGFANVKSGQKLDANTRFRIGSISKTFVAVLLMQAVESGKMSLQDPLSLFFPTLKNAEHITLEDMLRHQSGIFNYTASEGFLEWQMTPRTHEEIFALIDAGGSVFPPKTQTEYSNSNYYLLARILETVHQKPYSEILKEGITEPLGLKNTALAEAIDPKKNEALSHVFVEWHWQGMEHSHPSVSLGAGDMVSTVADLTVFMHSLFSGKLISSETFASMLPKNAGEFGLGVIAFPAFEHIAYGHNGLIDGFHSMLVYVPSEELLYVRLANAIHMQENDIDIAALSAALGLPYEIPTFEDYAYTAEELEGYAGVYGAADFPFQITVFVKDGMLFAQATGQSEFPLESFQKGVFSFELTGIEMRFDPENHSLQFSQWGQEWVLKKK